MKTLTRTRSVSLPAYNGIDCSYKIENPESHAVNNYLTPLDFDSGKVLHVYFTDIPAFIYLFEREIYPQKENNIYIFKQ